jgi:response regulator RpfG family c-di-GMP phosphodiesterase
MAMKTETIRVLLIDDDEDEYILTRELLADALRAMLERWTTASLYESR